MSDTTLAALGKNPFPAWSFFGLAVMAFLFLGPRFIEGTETTCEAVSLRVVRNHPDAAQAPEFVLRAAARQLTQTSLATTPWHNCSALYWLSVFDAGFFDAPKD